MVRYFIVSSFRRILTYLYFEIKKGALRQLMVAFMKNGKKNHLLIKCQYCGTDNDENNNICTKCGRLIKERGTVPKDYRAIGSIIVIVALFVTAIGGAYFLFTNKDKTLQGTQTSHQSNTQNTNSSQSSSLFSDYGKDNEPVEIYDTTVEENTNSSQNGSSSSDYGKDDEPIEINDTTVEENTNSSQSSSSSSDRGKDDESVEINDITVEENTNSSQNSSSSSDRGKDDEFVEINDTTVENNMDEPQFWGIITSTHSKGIAIHPVAKKDSDVIGRIHYQEVFPIYYIEPNTTYGYTIYNGISGYINLDYADIYDNNYDADSYSADLTDYGLYRDGHGINEYDYVIADSDSRYLTQDDIDKLTLRGINYAKNEIYARHGRDFKSSELKRFFNSRAWYSVQYSLTDENDVKITNMFNQYEKENSKFLNDAETRLGTYDLD